MATRRDLAKSGLHRPSPDEDKPARKRARSERTRFLKNDRRRVRRALEPDYRDGERARRYGLSLADYRALQKRQGNACAICRKVVRVLCIDHCHVTGRGLRTPQYTYAVAAPKVPGWRAVPAADRYVEYMLYDLNADPYQHVNLAGRATHQKVFAELRPRLLARIREASGATAAIEPCWFPYP